METLFDTPLTLIIVVFVIVIANMHLRIRSLEKKLGK